MTQPYLKLNDGNTIPQIGLGVFLIPGGKPTENSCLSALECGYRHIDTAHAYQNERSVGKAVRESGVPRDEVFITSKIWPTEYGEGMTSDAIDRMLRRLDTDHIDLLLLHQQVGDYMGAWRDMEKAVGDGRVRSIGLSNFDGPRLDQVLSESRIKPAVLQVECHPYYQERDVKDLLSEYGTRIMSWYPIGHGDKGLINQPVFTELAEKYGKSNVQVILRWHVQEGNIVIPGSQNPDHIRSNLDICDFELTEDEIESIRALDCGKRFYNSTYEQQKSFLSWSPQD